MSDVRAFKAHKLARNVGLLASASLLSILMTGEAHAACTPPPLNNVPANTTVTCSGTVTNPTIFITGPNSGVLIDPGSTINGGGVTLSESNNSVNAIGTNANPITLDDFSIASTSGAFSNRQINFAQVNASNLNVSLLGNSALFNILNGSTLTMTPGNFYVEGGTTQATRAIVNMAQGSSLSALGPGNGQALIQTGNGFVEMNFTNSTLTTASDNLLIQFGGGDDLLTMTGMTLNGGSAGPLLIAGGAGEDSLILNAGTTSRSYDLTVTGFENATLSAAAGQRLTLAGTADYDNVTIGGGIVRVDAISALGSNTANVAISSGSTLEFNENAFQSLNHSFSGSGTIHQLEGQLAFYGDSSGFTGNYILDFNRAFLFSNNALGSATITNNSLLFFGDINLPNNIGGTGQVAKIGTGTATISGNNTFSGGLTVSQGTLIALGVNSLGTGGIAGANNTTLVLNAASNQILANNISGQLQFVKEGTGIVDLTGTNSYNGGTIINAGGVRVDDLARLGVGPVVANAGGSLILNHNGAAPMSLTSPIMTGAGQFVKQGSGEVVVEATNSYTGGTLIDAGILRFGANDALGTGLIGIGGAGTLALGTSAFSPLVTNDIAGSGTILIDQTGGAELSGNNSAFTGAINLTGASSYLYVQNGAALGSGSVNLIGTGTLLQIDNSLDTTVAAGITGNGTVEKSGAGRLILSGAGAMTGGVIDVFDGTLQLEGSNNIGAAPVINLAGGTTLNLHSIQTRSLANAITGAGMLVKTGSGTTDVTGTSSYSGNTDIQQGALRITNSGALGSGAVTIAANAELIFNNSSAATFSTAISGAGTLRKQGTGLLSFASNFSIANLALSAGRTRMNVIGTANVNVGAGATLDGTGRIVGNLTNNGIVAPGNSIGTLTVQGNYVHNSGAVLEIEFDGSGGIDLLSITGTATLNGGTLRFISLGGAEGSGGTFLTAAGGITGTFGTIETVGAQLPLAVIYQPNSALMAPSVLTARPSTFNAQSLAAADTSLAFIDSIGVADVRHGEGSRIWINGFGSWGKRSASGSTLGYNHDSHGLSGGVNIDVGGGLTLGAAAGWAKSDIRLGSNGGGGEQSNLLGSLHARYSDNDFTLGGGLLYGNVDQETLRNVSFNSFAASVEGQTDSDLLGGFAELGLPLGSAGAWSFSANARGSYIRQTQEGYTESGTSPLRLTVDEIQTKTMEGQVLLSAKTNLVDSPWGDDVPKGPDLRIDIGGRYLGALGDRKIPVTFASSNAGIVLQGDQRDGLHGLLGLGLDYTLSSGMTFSVGYRGEFGKTDRHSAQVGLSFGF